MLMNKTLMITGGTGSFGQAVLSRFLNTGVKEIRIFSRDEKKQEDMRIALDSKKIKFYLGDVRNYDSIYEAMNSVDYVFHAAALKQVPSCQFNPMEAVRTNILGSENVMNAAIANHVERVIVLSTDKAVGPINVMGLSKAIMEHLMIAKARMCSNGKTIFCATRYGNVLGSRGSVIPIFVEQLKNKRPLTVTDPKMTRFFMTLEESVDLVIHAFEKGCQGDIFVHKAPAATIEVLVRALKDLFSQDNPVRIIGTRHGEKLHESLISREELARAKDMGSYYRILSDARDLNYSQFLVEGKPEIAFLDDYTSYNTEQLDVEGVKKILRKLDCVRDCTQEMPHA